MGSLQLDQQGNNPKKSYAFWETQPVAQFNEETGSSTSIAVSHGTQLRNWQRGSRVNR